ncbi:MAG: bifunctional 5,10-methylenetetrahydrofolate dehydrogenase/5,10-methenyltetrahydrofolate cyclohydrolase [Planctomycetes bacterium]|nr:bifunctional 5,10-methylenetetrahydrofolate dehydrogenase/5,10-methenyltetrahydrofolate cyclohydrolase [Planctomycetota bacterium]
MTARIIDGKAIAAEVEGEVARAVAERRARGADPPCLAAVLVGEDPASQVYVRNKRRACERVGIESRLDRMPDSTTTDALVAHLDQLNHDRSVDGILVQLPLPASIDAVRVLDAIDPRKDVDAFHADNVGLLDQGRPRFLPCTPHGVLRILAHEGLAAAGRDVVIIGRSSIVGRPLAMMLTQRTSIYGPDYANATVTLCHTRTRDLASHARRADILIAAVGVARAVTGDMIRPGAVVIDVGINRTESGLVGDVDFGSAVAVAGRITPVPGGVGPLTIAMLLKNTLEAKRQRGE